jgi:hypothetical protein
MTQLTSLDLGGTLCASAAAVLRAGACERRLCMDDVACCGPGQLRAGLSRAVGIARGGPRGGGACRQSDRSSWGSVAFTESRMDDAADVAEPVWCAYAHR